MPTYDYKCSACGHHFERFMGISDTTEIQCPVCDTPAKRMISGGGGLLFKGSGFYETDYRKPDYKAHEKADKQS